MESSPCHASCPRQGEDGTESWSESGETLGLIQGGWTVAALCHKYCSSLTAYACSIWASESQSTERWWWWYDFFFLQFTLPWDSNWPSKLKKKKNRLCCEKNASFAQTVYLQKSCSLHVGCSRMATRVGDLSKVASTHSITAAVLTGGGLLTWKQHFKAHEITSTQLSPVWAP